MECNSVTRMQHSDQWHVRVGIQVLLCTAGFTRKFAACSILRELAGRFQ